MWERKVEWSVAVARSINHHVLAHTLDPRAICSDLGVEQTRGRGDVASLRLVACHLARVEGPCRLHQGTASASPGSAVTKLSGACGFQEPLLG